MLLTNAYKQSQVIIIYNKYSKRVNFKQPGWRQHVVPLLNLFFATVKELFLKAIKHMFSAEFKFILQQTIKFSLKFDGF